MSHPVDLETSSSHAPSQSINRSGKPSGDAQSTDGSAHVAEKDKGGLTVPEDEPRPLLIIVMGPASCGKSTVASLLAQNLSLPFIDGDSLHPASNVAKMSAGNPLTDADRFPWLALIRSTGERVCREEWEAVQGSLADEGDEGAKEGEVKMIRESDWRKTTGRPTSVIACSALKKIYRDILRGVKTIDPPSKSDLPENPTPIEPHHKAHIPASSNLETIFVYCYGTQELLEQRIAARKNHFMGAQMLASQLATLEDPRGEPDVCTVDISLPMEEEGKQAVEGVKRLIGLS